MKRKNFYLLFILVICLGLLVGCGGSKEGEEVVTDSGGDSLGNGEKVITLSNDGKIPTANIHFTTGSIEGPITYYIVGRPYQLVPSEDGETAERLPEIAEDLPENPSGDLRTWIIPVDKNAKWENGDPITADDLIYSYKTILDPILLSPSGTMFAQGFIEIENAIDYYTQASEDKKVDWEDVGITKIDDYTIEVITKEKQTQDDVVRHFAREQSGLVYEPLYEELMNADRTATEYGTDMDKILSCGPYKLEKWVQGAEHVLVKNENYVHLDRYPIDKVVYKAVQDSGTRMQMFQNGELDYVGLGIEDEKKYAEDPRTLKSPSRSVRCIEINRKNPDKPILDDVNFRKALFHAIDRDTAADLISATPANYYVSTTSIAYADGTPYRELDGAKEILSPNLGYDPELSKELFETALKDAGLDKLTLTLDYSDSQEAAKVLSEYLQESLKELWGEDKFELVLKAMPTNQMLDNMKGFKEDPTSYELSWSIWGWTPADFSPNRDFDVFRSDYPRRNAPYDNAEFDALLDLGLSEEVRLDEKKRAEVTFDIEKMFLDDVIACPVTQGQNFAMVTDRVILPMKVPHVEAGWGLRYADILEEN